MKLRIAIIQAMDGHTTICGPNDYEDGGHHNAWSAAMSWHLEAGHLPAATYWVEIELPDPPTVPGLRQYPFRACSVAWYRRAPYRSISVESFTMVGCRPSPSWAC